MTVLLYSRIDLEESVSKSYNLWKGCHITSYALAAIFGLLNFYFLYLTMKIFGEQCVLNPHELVFREVLPRSQDSLSVPPGSTTAETAINETVGVLNETAGILNFTAVNETSQKMDSPDPMLILDLQESKFHMESYCELPLYTPLVSTIFGVVWGTLFIMCPAGGRSKNGLSEPWRILGPALVFALVFVFFTGHNFFSTNGGLQALCANFYNVTNTTSCTRRMDAYIPEGNERGAADIATPASVAVGAARAACAGVWACWATACALLLARCVAGADFTVHRTEVHLHSDPGKKLTRLMKPQKQVQIDESVNISDPPYYHGSPLSMQSRDNDNMTTTGTADDSITSEPTISSDLNTTTYSPAFSGRALNERDEQRKVGPNQELYELSYSPSERK